jgi:hypothetical protein
VVAAWQGALAAEQQAVFGYGLLGVHLSGAQRDLALQCQQAHARLRDATVLAIRAAGLDPVADQADYPALYPVPDAGAARRLAVRLEDECALAWRVLYLRAASTTAAAARSLRTGAQAALTASAVRATRWRAIESPRRATDPFPGI